MDWPADWLSDLNEVFIEKPVVIYLLKKFPTLCGTQSFIIVFNVLNQI